MRRELAEGLILRSLSEGFTSDAEGLPAFYADTFGEAGESDTIALAAWARTLISGRHPTVTHDDIWVVVDPARDEAIVSAVLLIPQIWQIEDTPVTVGRVELVATHRDYRRRGLVRALINAAHERSQALGHLMQSITGIENYYRRFGYAMALDLGARTTVPFFAIRDLPEDEMPTYPLRRATADDAEKLAAWDAAYATRHAISHPRDAAVWRFELSERDPDEVWMPHTYIIIGPEGQELGYVLLRAVQESTWLACYSWVMNEHGSLINVYMDVLRGIKAFGLEFFTEAKKPLPEAISFSADLPELFDELVQATPGGRMLQKVYAWYLRVPDLAAFIRHLTPVLERRLATSLAHGHTGTLKISLYDLTGLELRFNQGRLVSVEHRPFALYEGDIGFPDHTFLNVLFGHRTPAEVGNLYPEVQGNTLGRTLVPILFPKQRAWVFPLG